MLSKKNQSQTEVKGVKIEFIQLTTAIREEEVQDRTRLDSKYNQNKWGSTIKKQVGGREMAENYTEKISGLGDSGVLT